MLAPAIAACAAVFSRKEEADHRAQAAYAQCESLREAHRLATHLAAVDCAIPTVVGAYREAAYPFEDLLFMSIQARRIGAGRLDRGGVSEDEEKRDLATLGERIAAEEKRRFAVMGASGNLRPMTSETLVQGLVSFAPEPTPEAVAPPLPGSPANCFTIGGAQRCN